MSNYIAYQNSINIKKYHTNNNLLKYKNNMIITIPKIKLDSFVYKAKDDFSNLNTNIVYYKNKDYNESIIIFGHSGIGYGTFFNRIDELTNKDILYLYVDNKKLLYEFKSKYYVSYKNVEVLDSNKKNTLFLITCKKKDKTKRLVEEFMLKSA